MIAAARASMILTAVVLGMPTCSYSRVCSRKGRTPPATFVPVTSSGNATIIHLAGQMYLSEADVKARHIPYKGMGPMIVDIMGGRLIACWPTRWCGIFVPLP